MELTEFMAAEGVIVVGGGPVGLWLAAELRCVTCR